MRILLTNDDGIFAPGMRVMMDFARRLGEVVVYAPKSEQSGKSHAIEIHQPFTVEPVALPHGIQGYSVDSTPADCVRVAMMAMEEEFDLVFSGINHGYNLGREITYSGTVGAALEAGVQGTKAIALSTRRDIFTGIEKHLDTMWGCFEASDLFAAAPVWNVNIPEECTGKIVLARQGGPFYSDTFFLKEGNASVEGKLVWRPGNDTGVDTDAVLQYGHIALTPLTNDRTNYEAFEMLKK